MSEWHVTPDYIVSHWTDELLDLMVRKLTERKMREASPVPEEKATVPVDVLAATSGGMVKVVTKRGD